MPPVEDTFQGVKVEMVSQGRVLDFYDDPDAEQDAKDVDPYRRVQYVEAVHGNPFAVRVTICKSFKLYSQDAKYAVRIIVASNDGNDGGASFETCREEIERHARAGMELSHVFEQFWTSSSHGQWLLGKPVFSPLVTEGMNGTQITPERVKKLGSMKIVIGRVMRYERATPKLRAPSSLKPITAVSEKLIKGKAIDNIIGLQTAVQRQPPLDLYRFERLPGEAGKRIRFEVRYRSKQNLQSLGCIPRTPTPEPDLREQNRELRERLALLESRNAKNIKAESLRSMAGVKRERGDANTNRDSKKPRILEPEFVDLTAD